MNAEKESGRRWEIGKLRIGIKEGITSEKIERSVFAALSRRGYSIRIIGKSYDHSRGIKK